MKNIIFLLMLLVTANSIHGQCFQIQRISHESDGCSEILTYDMKHGQKVFKAFPPASMVSFLNGSYQKLEVRQQSCKDEEDLSGCGYWSINYYNDSIAIGIDDYDCSNAEYKNILDFYKNGKFHKRVMHERDEKSPKPYVDLDATGRYLCGTTTFFIHSGERLEDINIPLYNLQTLSLTGMGLIRNGECLVDKPLNISFMILVHRQGDSNMDMQDRKEIYLFKTGESLDLIHSFCKGDLEVLSRMKWHDGILYYNTIQQLQGQYINRIYAYNPQDKVLQLWKCIISDKYIDEFVWLGNKMYCSAGEDYSGGSTMGIYQIRKRTLTPVIEGLPRFINFTIVEQPYAR